MITTDMTSILCVPVHYFCRFNNSARPSFSQPWTKSAPRSTTGSGFVLNVKQRLIVTNAHVVAFGCTILVRKDGDNDKYEALILTVSHQVDIAIVTVLDEMFWKDACTLPLGALPRFQQAVDVIGYPMGGSTISISSGVVSRIDWTNYCHSFEWNLCIQVDAAINAGNSGIVVSLSECSSRISSSADIIFPQVALRCPMEW